MSGDGTTAVVAALPKCETHTMVSPRDTSEPLAAVDGKTVIGPWAMMCSSCWERIGVGLGTGRGQRLILQNPCASPGPDGSCQCKCEGCGHDQAECTCGAS